MPKIDEEQWSRGRTAFKNGVSLRALVDAMHASDDEDREMSFVLGFVDAAFDKLRGIER